jgi:hypothetical protein
MSWIIFVLIIILIISLFMVLMLVYKREKNEHIPFGVHAFQFNSKFTNKDVSDNPGSPILEIIESNNFRISKKFADANLIIFSDYSYIDQNIESVSFNKNINYFIYAINGSDEFASKSNLARYMKKRNKAHQIPRTFILENDEDITELKEYHKENNLYMVKKNVQRQEGNLITKDIDFILNGADKETYVVCQELLQNPYIVSGRKINMRIYLLIVTHDDKISFFIYKNGFMYYTPKMFEKRSIEKDVNITTGYIDRQVYIDNPLTIKDFYKYLGEEKSQILEQNIIQTFKDFKTVYSDVLVKKNKKIPGYKFNIFGADIAPDENLETTLIEINKGPDLSYKDDRDKNVKLTMMVDCFNIMGLSKQGNPNNFIKI